MSLLLDTCTLLWWLAGHELSPASAQAIAEPDNAVWVSAASIWEIGIKQSLGKLSAPVDLDSVIDEDFEHLSIGFTHCRIAARLPQHHRDPFGRMLIAQAQAENLTLVTRDDRISSYDVKLLRS
ncbi:MAG: type II toxin-antitoxin system VapC family toxin [Acidimicrobiaceae bacterium]|nr:type II toxin-antitoxin system VapC family toxin [Acidimicrobiaceae bacterium]MCY4280900.1 type II toxin-antitoxin system VapC family toxin [Acidimicrobiaceae bacterium]MCY4294070.1 type II toxin-antitoxin system VapC family toxin [Acidimicrobiaceae bacterium]